MIRCWLLGVPSLLIPSVPLLRPVKCTACTLGPALTASWLQFCVLKAGELRWGYFVVSLQKAEVLIYQDKNVLWNILKPDSAFMWAWRADCCGHKRPQSLPPALDSVTQSQEKDFNESVLMCALLQGQLSDSCSDPPTHGLFPASEWHMISDEAQRAAQLVICRRVGFEVVHFVATDHVICCSLRL